MVAFLMLLSYSNKFIFIHIYRVAGTSITNSLESYTRRPVVRWLFRKLGIGNLIPYRKWKTFPSHIKARQLRSQLSREIYESFYKFAFVRNPWDWQVSLYHYMLRDTNHFQHKLIKTMHNFDEYINWRVYNDKELQKDFIVDSNGRLIVDFVGRYENLTTDFRHVCEVLNVSVILPHLNKSSHRDYKSYYNAKTRKLVEEHFSEDIEFFNYTF